MNQVKVGQIWKVVESRFLPGDMNNLGEYFIVIKDLIQIGKEEYTKFFYLDDCGEDFEDDEDIVRRRWITEHCDLVSDAL
jgi:hypothetical protein